MRLCYVCVDYPPFPQGGIGTMTTLFARELIGRGHTVRVIGVYPASSGLLAEENVDGVSVVRILEPSTKLGWLRARLQLWRTVKEWAQKAEIDLVEVPDHRGWAAFWPSLPIPVLTRLHGSGSFLASLLGKRLGILNRIIESQSLRRADYVCAVSKFVASQTERLFGRKLDPPPEVLFNPVEVPREVAPFSARSKNRVVFVGSVTEMKGVFTLFRAWPPIREKHPAAELHLFGKDTLQTDGESTRATLLKTLPLDVRDSVVFHGHVARADVLEALQNSRIVVLPSFVEAFAFAPLESMAAGCATIYTSRGSGREVIRPGDTGILIDPEDSETLAEEIIGLLEDDVRAEALGMRGRERVLGDFELQKLMTRNEGFYRDCIAGFRRRSRVTGRIGNVSPREAGS